jgi:hypothetical protein
VPTNDWTHGWSHGFDLSGFKARLLEFMSHVDGAGLADSGPSISFEVVRTNLDDHPALAMSYYTSLKAASVPVLRVDGSFAEEHRLYLDSRQLQAQLRPQLRLAPEKQDKEGQRKDIGGKGKGKGAKGRGKSKGKGVSEGRGSTGAPQPPTSGEQTSVEGVVVMEVPVFVFAADSSTKSTAPLLLDKHKQAVAGDEMVLVVQSQLGPGSWDSSDHSVGSVGDSGAGDKPSDSPWVQSRWEWEGPIACNGQPVGVDLRNPLRPALAATMEFIAGLQAAHQPRRRRGRHTGQMKGGGSDGEGSKGGGRDAEAMAEAETENWLWSVGNSPLSLTCSQSPEFAQPQFSTIHHDSVQRLQLHRALSAAWAMVAVAVQTLRSAEYELRVETPGQEQAHQQDESDGEKSTLDVRLQEQELQRKRAWERERQWEREWEWEIGEASSSTPLSPPSSVLDRLHRLKLDIQVCERLWTRAAADAAALWFTSHPQQRFSGQEFGSGRGDGESADTAGGADGAGTATSAAVDAGVLNALLDRARGVLSTSRQLHRALQQQLQPSTIPGAGCGTAKGAKNKGMSLSSSISVSAVATVAAISAAVAVVVSILWGAVSSWSSRSGRKKKPKLN